MTKAELVAHLVSDHKATGYLIGSRTMKWLRRFHEERHSPDAVYPHKDRQMVPHSHARRRSTAEWKR